MDDAASRSDATMQRAVGELRVALRVRDGRTVLDGLLPGRLPERRGFLGQNARTGRVW